MIQTSRREGSAHDWRPIAQGSAILSPRLGPATRLDATARNLDLSAGLGVGSLPEIWSSGPFHGAFVLRLYKANSYQSFALGCHDYVGSWNLVGYHGQTRQWVAKNYLAASGTRGLHGPRRFNMLYCDGHASTEDIMAWGDVFFGWERIGPWTAKAGD